MRKLNISKFLIIIGAVAFTLVFSFAVVTIYQQTLDDAKLSHQMQQMEMAKAATIGISSFLEHLAEDMFILNFFPGFRVADEKFIHANINYLLNHHHGRVLHSIFIADSTGVVIYTKGDSLPEWVELLVTRQSNWIRRPQNNESCWYSQVQRTSENEENKGLSFVMLTPILQNKNGRADNDESINVIGAIGYLVDFDLLIDKFIEPLKLGTYDFAWIIDGYGRLIYHPKHQEMLLRSTLKTGPECFDCHTSFDIQNKMLTGKPAFGEYVIADEPAKIMAYVPIRLNDEKWVVVISTLLPEVTANLRDKFQIFFILGILILVVITLLGLSLYNANAKRIRAEEAKRQSEQLQQLQQQLNYASKLASIGELVDTVAHEINTPTGIIAANADALLLQQNPKKYCCAEEMHLIKNQTRRIHEYTRSLLGFSKRLPFNPQPINLNEILDESVFLLGHRFRAQNIDIVKNYENDLPKLVVDRGQMEQVFVNLLNNAVDAMEGSGRIKIETTVSRGASKFEEDDSIKNISVSIGDNGSGIKSSDISQIFEPFFSTKRPTEGTGLGLYISKSIIQRHHGMIKVSSELGKGTIFRILLPIDIEWDN